jgi:hypothetical protein
MFNGFGGRVLLDIGTWKLSVMFSMTFVFVGFSFFSIGVVLSSFLVCLLTAELSLGRS